MNKEDSNIRYIEEIPPAYRTVFQEYPCFNTVQSSVLDDALQTDNSLVVSAPTGSGKTAIFEMAIVRILMLNEKPDLISNIKMIYSDTDDIDVRNISHYNLIITTPEKWDSVTRRWKNNQALLAAVNLVMIDEVHLLNIDFRGSTLEVIVSRMKTSESFLLLNREKPKIRFIALSATIPNVEDIAEWIGPNGTAKYFKFSEDVRPVTLDKIVYGFNNNSKTAFKFDLGLNYKLPNLISKYSKGKPTLIFCSTRKSVEMTTSHLVTNLQIRLSLQQKMVLNQISDQINDAKLKKYIVHGIALHHAGLIPENRNIIESSFREGHLPLLVTTSTLAMGVNLPAHLVIIKGTKRYDTNEGFKDYDEVSIFQMIGRAGRNQLDTSATAIILTSTQDKIKYENLLKCTQNIESNLHKHLTEHLNAEIVLKTITDLEVAMNWLSSTFLYVRARKCPEKYKLPAGLSKEKIDKKLLEICQIELNRLVRSGIIKMSQEIEIAPTVVGEIMAKYYIAFNTMELFTKISGNEIMIQILALFSKCHEFSEIYLRSNDKKCLNLLNKNTSKESIRFPLTGRITTGDMKINCIIQAVLGNLDIPDQSILNDSTRVMRNCERLANCLIEYLETRTKCYTALLNTIILAKCFRVKLWENSPYVSKQLTGVGQVISTLLAKARKTTFKEIINTNPRHIEMIVGRKAPFGNTFVEEVSHLPEYQMTLEKCNNNVNLVINLLNSDTMNDKSTVKLASKMTLLVGDSDNNVVLYEKYAHSYMLEHPKVVRSLNIENPNLTHITADLISEDWVGFDCRSKLELSPPINGTNQPTNTTQNKSTKQTFMEMYVKNVTKANTIKKKNESKTVLKKNTNNGVGNQSETVPEQEKTIIDKENQEKNVIKNKNNHNIYEIKEIDTSHIGLCNNNGNNANTMNNPDACRPIGNTNLEQESAELKTISKTEQKLKNSGEITTNCKKRRILVPKTIFRTKSKYKDSQESEKRTKSKRSKNHFNMSLENCLSKERNILQGQNNEITSQLKDDEITQYEVQNQIQDDDKNQTYRISSESKVLKKSLPCRYLINNFKTNETPSECGTINTETANMKGNISNNFFPCQTQATAGRDAFKTNLNILKKSKLDFSGEKYEDSNNQKQFKDFKSNSNYQEKDIGLNRDKSAFIDNNIHSQVSPVSCYRRNKNVEELFPLQSEIKLAVDNNNMKRSEQQEPKRQVNEPLLKYENECSDISNYYTKNESNQIHDFHISASLKSFDNSKVDSPHKTQFFAKNNNKYNTSLANCNDKEAVQKPDKGEKDKSKTLEQNLCDTKYYSDLYKKYNLRSPNINKNHNKNYQEKENLCIEKPRTIRESQDKDIKVIMDFPYSAVMQNLSQKPDFLTPNPKRFREIEDSFSCIDGSQTKRIKWRSPLVHSPPEMSPHSLKDRSFCLDLGSLASQEDTKDSNELRSGTHDTSSSSTNLNLSLNSQKISNHTTSSALSRKKQTFPLSDDDYLEKTDLKNLEDICDLESFGLDNRQLYSLKDTKKNSLQLKPSAGEYYSQLMSSQPKNLKEGPQANDTINDKNITATSDSVSSEPILCKSCASLRNKQSKTSEVTQSDTNFKLPSSKFTPYPKSAQVNNYSQNISHEYYNKSSNTQTYKPHVINENKLDNFGIYSGKENCFNMANMNSIQQNISSSSYNPLNHQRFTNLQKSNEIPQQNPLNSNYYNNGHSFQPDPYFNPQQPVRDDTIYQHQNMLPLYPLSSHLSTMHFRHPASQYGNVNSYYKEPYSGFMPGSNYAEEHINNTILRDTPTYHSHIGKEYVDHYNQALQDLHDRSLHFTLGGNNTTQEQFVGHLNQANPYNATMSFSTENQNYPSNAFLQSNRHDKENFDRQLTHNNDDSFMFGQACSRSDFYNNPSQLDNWIGQSHVYTQNTQKHEDLPKNLISQMFAKTPKQQFQHNPSQKPTLIKTPNSNLMTPLPSQRKLLNINSFEERLDTMVSPRNQSSIRPTTMAQRVPQNNSNATSCQPNDKDFVMNRFLFASNRN